jgi:tetratricopeptide (TPR) repeat protein
MSVALLCFSTNPGGPLNGTSGCQRKLGAQADNRANGRIINPELPMKAFAIFLAALGFVQATEAQTADDYRGGFAPGRARLAGSGCGPVRIRLERSGEALSPVNGARSRSSQSTLLVRRELPYAKWPDGRSPSAAGLGLQEDPLNFELRLGWAICLAAAGRDEEAADEFHGIMEANPAALPSQFNLIVYHVARGALDQALAFCQRAYALAPRIPHVIGLFAGLLKRTGDTHRSDELLRKLEPGDAYGAARGLAVYHWVLGEFEAEADWLERAIDQRDYLGAAFLRVWFGRELRFTPRWAGLMRKLNLPES